MTENVVQLLCFENALKIATTAKKLLAKAGKAANITVSNAFGQQLVIFHMDNARPMTQAVARTKAMQAAYTSKSTMEMRELVIADTIPLSITGLQEIHPYGGGVPIFDKETGILLGSIGISNLTEEEDHAFAMTAVREAGYLTEKPKLDED